MCSTSTSVIQPLTIPKPAGMRWWQELRCLGGLDILYRVAGSVSSEVSFSKTLIHSLLGQSQSHFGSRPLPTECNVILWGGSKKKSPPDHFLNSMKVKMGRSHQPGMFCMFCISFSCSLWAFVVTSSQAKMSLMNDIFTWLRLCKSCILVHVSFQVQVLIFSPPCELWCHKNPSADPLSR